MAQTLPYPPSGGVKIRTFHTLRILASEFDVTGLCFYRWKRGRLEPDVDAAVDELKRYGKIVPFPIASEHNRYRFAVDHLRSLVQGKVYTRYVYESGEFRRRLEDALAESKFDIVHADSLDLSAYFPEVGRSIPLVCVHHDVQSVLLERRAERAHNSVVSTYLRMQASLMRREEERVCPQVALNVTVSEHDRSTLLSLAPGADVTVVPNGVDTEYFRPRSVQQKGLCFVGGTTWFPNKDALNYYTTSVLPELRALVPGTATTWVGRVSAEELGEFATTEDLILTGFVPDVRPYLAGAECVVVPLRVGGGTRIKILDAWAMGKAVVSTSIGCEGLDARDGENILIADKPREFAAAISRVLADETLRERLGRNARETVVRSYSWDVIGQDMLTQYRRLIREWSALRQLRSSSC